MCEVPTRSAEEMMMTKLEDPKLVWEQLMKEAKSCRRVWGMGFPVISTFLLRKYWKRVTGYEPPED